jgi:hypoxanthine phosphoribosyltransferase
MYALKKKREEKNRREQEKKKRKKIPTTVVRWVWVVLCWQRAKKNVSQEKRDGWGRRRKEVRIRDATCKDGFGFLSFLP